MGVAGEVAGAAVFADLGHVAGDGALYRERYVDYHITP